MFNAFGSSAPKTVDSVMASFNQTLKDLEDVERQHADKAAAHRLAAAEADHAAVVAQTEAKRAASVAGQLRALVGG